MHTDLKTIYFKVSDGTRLCIRELCPEHKSKKVLLFLHGGSLCGKFYLPFGEKISKLGIKVGLIDLRGHGDSEGKPGDVKYIGQLEDDLNEIINQYITHHPIGTQFILAGHSLGAMVILRFIKKYGISKIANFLFIAPAIMSVEMVRYHSIIERCLYRLVYYRKLKNFHRMPPSIQSDAPRMSILKTLLALLFPVLRGKITIVTFADSKKIPYSEKRVLKYTYNMVASYNLSLDYGNVVAKIKKPSLFLIGSNDEIVNAKALKIAISWNTSQHHLLSFYEIPNGNHYNIPMLGLPVIIKWLSEI